MLLADVSERGGEEAVERITAEGGRAAFVRADLASSDAVKAMGIAQLDRVLTDQQIASIVAFLDTLSGTYRGEAVRPATAGPRAAIALP